MNGIHHTMTAALVAEHQAQLHRDAEAYRRAAALPRTRRHYTVALRKALLALATTVATFFAGSSAATAGAAPLIEPAPAGGAVPTGGGAGSSTDLLGTWAQVTLAVIVTVAVVAAIAFVVGKVRRHAPSAA